MFQPNGLISRTIMANYVRKYRETVLATCRRLFSKQAAKTNILYGQLVSGGVTDSETSMMTVNWSNKRILWESSCTPCYALATDGKPLFEEPQRLHLQDQTDKQDSSKTVRPWRRRPFERAVITDLSAQRHIPTWWKYFPSARGHVSLLTNTLFIGHRNFIA